MRPSVHFRQSRQWFSASTAASRSAPCPATTAGKSRAISRRILPTMKWRQTHGPKVAVAVNASLWNAIPCSNVANRRVSTPYPSVARRVSGRFRLSERKPKRDFRTRQEQEFSTYSPQIDSARVVIPPAWPAHSSRGNRGRCGRTLSHGRGVSFSAAPTLSLAQRWHA